MSLSWVHVMVMALHKENYRFNKLSRWIEASPATVIVEQSFLGVLRTHRFGERLYCIQPRKLEIVNVYPSVLCI